MMGRKRDDSEPIEPMPGSEPESGKKKNRGVRNFSAKELRAELAKAQQWLDKVEGVAVTMEKEKIPSIPIDGSATFDVVSERLRAFFWNAAAGLIKKQS